MPSITMIHEFFAMIRGDRNYCFIEEILLLQILDQPANM